MNIILTARALYTIMTSSQPQSTAPYANETQGEWCIN